MSTIQIELTNDPPRKWSTNVEHLTIFDLTTAVLKKLDPRGKDLDVRQVKYSSRWDIRLDNDDIGTIESLTKPTPTPNKKPVVKGRRRRPRTTRTGAKRKMAA